MFFKMLLKTRLSLAFSKNALKPYPDTHIAAKKTLVKLYQCFLAATISFFFFVVFCPQNS